MWYTFVCYDKIEIYNHIKMKQIFCFQDKKKIVKIQNLYACQMLILWALNIAYSTQTLKLQTQTNWLKKNILIYHSKTFLK